jgi:hypothetical protein
MEQAKIIDENLQKFSYLRKMLYLRSGLNA